MLALLLLLLLHCCCGLLALLAPCVAATFLPLLLPCFGVLLAGLCWRCCCCCCWCCQASQWFRQGHKLVQHVTLFITTTLCGQHQLQGGLRKGQGCTFILNLILLLLLLLLLLLDVWCTMRGCLLPRNCLRQLLLLLLLLLMDTWHPPRGCLVLRQCLHQVLLQLILGPFNDTVLLLLLL
jgi:hypothetical protein